MQKTLAKCESRGAFLFNPKFRKFWLESKQNRPSWFGLVRIFDNTFEGGTLWTVLLVWPKWQFPFDIIVVTSTAHLYPAYKYPPKHTVAWVRSVQLECTSVPLGCVEFFQNFKQEFLLNGTHHKARCGWHSSAVPWVDKRF